MTVGLGSTGTGGVRADLRAGGIGFLVASVAAVLLLGGLWALAREGPSAKSARPPVSPPTVVAERGRFGVAVYPTARAVRARTPTPELPAWGLPRRRASMPTPTGLQVIVGAIRAGDATGMLQLGPTEESGSVARPSPIPTRARSER